MSVSRAEDVLEHVYDHEHHHLDPGRVLGGSTAAGHRLGRL